MDIFKNINRFISPFFDDEVTFKYTINGEEKSSKIGSCVFFVQDEAPFYGNDMDSDLVIIEVIFPQESWEGERKLQVGDKFSYDGCDYSIKGIQHHNGDYRIMGRSI